MKIKQLLSYTRRAVEEYKMIDEGDKIAVGVSGGKDSLTLLYALNSLKRFYPKHFDIHAVTVDLGFQNQDLTKIESFCKELNVPYTIVHTRIADTVLKQIEDSNPCFTCAKMRKGVLNKEMKRLNCNKIAYAHHKDDAIETMLMSLIYEGRFHTFSPCTYLDRTELTLIRPLIYIDESEIVDFAHNYQLPVSRSECPADGHTKREYASQLLDKLETENPGARKCLFASIIRGDMPGWLSHKTIENG